MGCDTPCGEGDVLLRQVEPEHRELGGRASERKPFERGILTPLRTSERPVFESHGGNGWSYLFSIATSASERAYSRNSCKAAVQILRSAGRGCLRSFLPNGVARGRRTAMWHSDRPLRQHDPSDLRRADPHRCVVGRGKRYSAAASNRISGAGRNSDRSQAIRTRESHIAADLRTAGRRIAWRVWVIISFLNRNIRFRARILQK